MYEISLAQFVQIKREALGLSASGLAKKCHLELALIQSIEAGESRRRTFFTDNISPKLG
jgi:ribosome-binding protein aMBF1 (putative translation factor)